MINYIKLGLAVIKGDKDQANLIRNERLSKSAINGQLAALEGKKINQEMQIEKCTEDVKNAVLNIKGESVSLISSSEEWIANVKRAKNALVQAEEELEQIEESIAEWEALASGEYYQEVAE